MKDRRVVPVRFTLITTALLFCLAGADKITPATQPAAPPAMDSTIARIRDEGLNRSHIDSTLDYLCNVIGQRLTASPSQAKASQWTRDTLEKWGLADSHLERWGPFGKGWSVEHFSLQVTQPYPIILTGYPDAWSPGFDQPVELDVLYLDARTGADLQKYGGKLKGKAVLIGQLRTIEAHFDPQADRYTADQLAKLASAPLGRTKNELLQASTGPASQPAIATSRPTSRASVFAQTAAASFATEEFNFAAKEGAAVVINPSSRGDGGIIFVSSASVPGPATRPATRRTGPTTRPKPWQITAPAIPPQITITTEDFNRLVHILAQSEPVKLALDLRVKFYLPAETNCCNTIAEIPGSDLKDQVVMVGGHLDSWQSATGATDNAAGAACAMEAVRILRALDLHPRRTIRVALWTGEEQGLLGSAAYVKQHFGSYPDEAPGAASQPVTRPASDLIKKPEYEGLSVYFNLDNGTGKIRGIYAQSNPAAVPYFHQWLQPFADLSADTVTLTNTGSTDHISFDHIGLPGFQFIQDPIEYFPRTHHSNADLFDRIQMGDVKEASTVMAACLWDAANTDARFPRVPVKP